MDQYEVFISFKHLDYNKNQTEDSSMAVELYNALMSRGIRTFYCNKTLEIVGISQYKKAIDAALDACKVLIVVGTCLENINSEWVRYEWDSFYNDILSNIKPNAKIFSYIDKMSLADLPRTLRQLQVFEKREYSLQNICNYIEHALGIKSDADMISADLTKDQTSLDSKFEILDGKNIKICDIEQAIMLDEITYGNEYWVTLDRCLGWFERNNQIYTMLKENKTGRIIAYINVSPVTDEYYEKIKQGDFIDAFLPSEAIIEYDMPSLYNIYFSSIVIHPDFQNTGAFKPLFDALVEKFINLGTNDILIKRMIADAVTEKGAKFCMLFGMEKINLSKHNSVIYEVQFLPPKFKVSSKATSALFKFYTQKAIELDFIV